MYRHLIYNFLKKYMKNQNKIFNKYINLLVVVAKYTYARKWKDITPEDIFVALLNWFNKNEIIKKFFLSNWLELDKLLNIFNPIYSLEDINIFDIWNRSFKLSDQTIYILENLNSVENQNLFIFTLFLDLLYEKNIFNILSKNWYSETLEWLNVKKLLDLVYSDKKILLEFDKTISLKEILPTLEENNIQRIIAQDDYSDYDYLDDEIENTDKNTKKTVNTNKTSKDKLVIDTFWTNLVLEAKKWNLEPVVGREDETKQVIYTLLRKTKSNPLLIWEAWVGKTAIIEGLAQKIANGDVPNKLKNKKIYMLDMWTLIAWTKFRWEFESRLKSIIEESINPDNNIILFIDEIHTIVWAWNQEWWVDTANIIKPHLARWELTIIWATTFDEYRKYIEKDPALTRRFQVVKIEEPNEQSAIKLLEGIKHRFEDFHWVNISSKAIEHAVKLSKRYILDKHLPDKAIDLIDEACSRVWEKAISKNIIKKIDKLNKEIEKLEKNIEKAVSEQDYFSAADYKEKISNIKQDIIKLQTTDDRPKEKRQTISEDNIEKVIVEKYWVSNSILSKSELEFLKDLKDVLNKEIIWQEQAVNDIVNSIIRNKLSPLQKSKPIWTFLFLWASWVWKTYLAKLLAKHFFQDENSLIKINMSEYSQDMSSNKLTWSAPGYVWYEEWWILTEAVRKKPYSVILFDEIEKWSSKILNILLQILDNGYLEDNKWRKIDFKNTIIILTSNLWAEYFTKQVVKIWFNSTNKLNKWLDQDKKDMILQEVKNLIQIELLNRFDKIIYFNNIDIDLLKKVFQKYYKEYKQLWKKEKWVNIPSYITKDEIDLVLSNIEEEWAWVRWIEKFIYNDLENRIIEKLLKSNKIK